MGAQQLKDSLDRVAEFVRQWDEDQVVDFDTLSLEDMRAVTLLARRAVLAGDEYLTVEEIAVMMRVSKMTIYRMVERGEIPSLRFGRSFRIRRSDLETYLEGAHFNA